MPALSTIISVPPRPDGDRANRLALLMNQAAAALNEDSFWRQTSVCWNAPSTVIAGGGREASAFRKAFAGRGRDCFLPMGFTGAGLHWLPASEQDAEISWAIENTWKTGRDDIGLPGPGWILVSPYSGGPIQPPGNTPVGFRTATSIVVMDPEGEMRSLPVVQAASDWYDRDIKKEMRKATRRSSNGLAFLELEICSETDVEFLATSLGTLGRSLTDMGISARPCPGLADWPAVNGATNQAPGLPPDALRQRAAAESRRRRRSRATTRETLEALAYPSGEQPAAKTVKLDAEFIASMMGDVSLAGANWSAEFSKGNLRGITCTDGASIVLECGGSVLGGFPAGAFTTASCFSFESEVSRGIRVVQHLQRKAPGALNATLVCDHHFVGEAPILFSSCAVAVRPCHGMVPFHWAPIEERLIDQINGVDPPSQLAETAPSFTLVLGDEKVSFRCLSRDGRAIWGSHVRVPDHKKRIRRALTFSLTRQTNAVAVTEFSVALCPGPEGVEILTEHLDGRIGAAILRVLANAPTFKQIRLKGLTREEQPEQER